MKLLDKLQILADSAKYDVSCSSSGSSRSNRPGGVGNASLPGFAIAGPTTAAVSPCSRSFSPMCASTIANIVSTAVPTI